MKRLLPLILEFSQREQLPVYLEFRCVLNDVHRSSGVLSSIQENNEPSTNGSRDL